MYTPEAFRVQSPEKLAAFMRAHSFATVITQQDGEITATHLPVLHRSGGGPHGTLISHMARANPQWRHFASGQEVLVIFQGPHAYVSASLYEAGEAVSTWNYTAVHAYGVPSLIEDAARMEQLIDDTVATYDPALPLPSGHLHEQLRTGLMKALVGFEIPISRIEGKFKLSQNRAAVDVRNVHAALSVSSDPGDRAVAGMMAAEGYVPGL